MSKSLATLITTIFLVVNAPATTAVEADLDLVTAEDLLTFCAVEGSDDAYPAAVGFCFGYLDAALDYHAALTAGPKFDAITCPPEDITRESVSATVLEWAKANPTAVSATSPVHVVMQALSETWPCTAN